MKRWCVFLYKKRLNKVENYRVCLLENIRKSVDKVYIVCDESFLYLMNLKMWISLTTLNLVNENTNPLTMLELYVSIPLSIQNLQK